MQGKVTKCMCNVYVCHMIIMYTNNNINLFVFGWTGGFVCGGLAGK